MVKHGGYVWVCLNMLWKPPNPLANHHFHLPIWSCYAYTGIYTPFSDRHRFTMIYITYCVMYIPIIYLYYIQLKILMCSEFCIQGGLKGKELRLANLLFDEVGSNMFVGLESEPSTRCLFVTLLHIIYNMFFSYNFYLFSCSIGVWQSAFILQ